MEDGLRFWVYGRKFEIDGVRIMKITDRDIEIMGLVLEKRSKEYENYRKRY